MSAHQGLAEDHLATSQHAPPSCIWCRPCPTCSTFNTQLDVKSWITQTSSSLSKGLNKTTCLHLPIGGKFFLYVNHSREVTSDKMLSFSTWRPEITILQIDPHKLNIYIPTHSQSWQSYLWVHCIVFLRSTQALRSQENLQTHQTEVCRMSR